MDMTKRYDTNTFQDAIILETLKEVANILKERGYHPINQLVGYLVSGDPGYITSYKDARKKIMQYDRNHLLEILLKDVIGNSCDI